MAEAPTVWIFIPTYNRSDYLGIAVRRALEQTHPSIGITVLDDASTDDTPEVVKRLQMQTANNHVPLNYHRHSHNLGIVGNWRFAFENCRADYFCLLHDDDVYEPEFCATLLKPLMQNSCLAFSFCDQWMMDETGKIDSNASDASSLRFSRDQLYTGVLANPLHSVLVDKSAPVGASVFRRDSVHAEDFNERAQGAIDMWFFSRLLTRGKAFYVDQRLMRYREHDGGMSQSMPTHMSGGHLFRLVSLLGDERFKPVWPGLRDELASVRAGCALQAVSDGSSFRSIRFAYQSMRDGGGLRAAAALFLACLGPIGPMVLRRIRNRK